MAVSDSAVYQAQRQNPLKCFPQSHGPCLTGHISGSWWDGVSGTVCHGPKPHDHGGNTLGARVSRAQARGSWALSCLVPSNPDTHPGRRRHCLFGGQWACTLRQRLLQGQVWCLAVGALPSANHPPSLPWRRVVRDLLGCCSV